MTVEFLKQGGIINFYRNRTKALISTTLISCSQIEHTKLLPAAPPQQNGQKKER